jgi:hypothetical protein
VGQLGETLERRKQMTGSPGLQGSSTLPSASRGGSGSGLPSATAGADSGTAVSFECHLQDAPPGRVNQVGRFVLGCGHAARPFDRRQQILYMKFSIVAHISNR